MPDLTSELADQIVGDPETPNASLRISTVTAVEATGNRRVQTSATSTAWLSRDADASLSVGDKVWIVQQGSVWLVGGRLSGGSSAPVGSLTVFAGSAAPIGWLLCDGAAVSRTTYAALFAVLGTTYGAGDGSTTFNVPNLQNRVPVGSGGTYARGVTGGASTVTLTTGQIPSHDHGSSGDHGHGSTGDHGHGSVGDHQHTVFNDNVGETAASGSGTASLAFSAGTQLTSAEGGHSHSNAGSHSHSNAGSHTHSGVGGGGSHENMPPFVALPYIVRAL